MMTSKIEDRLRKNGVKIKKYYKWLRWSMIEIFTAQFIHIDVSAIYGKFL